MRAGVLLLLGVTLLGCRTSLQTAEVFLAPDRAPSPPAGRDSAVLLTELPELSTYAWVDPSALLTAVDPTHDSLARAGVFDEQRSIATAVLRANGWFETDPERAAFHFALVDLTFLGSRIERRPDPRSLRLPPPKCQNLPAAQQQTCVEPPLPVYPPIAERVSFTERLVTFAVRRVHDGALRTWSVTPTSLRRTVPRSLVELIAANRP